MHIPTHGKSADQIKAQLEAFSTRDLPWREGKTLAYIYDPGAQVEEIAKWAYMRYLTENALDPTVYPSMMLIENELAEMARNHLGGVDGVVGNFTSGGTESCMLAVKTARDWARQAKGIANPEIILPVTAHAAFHKGAHYCDMKKVLVPVDPKTYKADPAAIARAITPNTAMIVISAVSYAHGVLDPVPEIAAIAQKHGVLCHVDGCIGGFLLPYFKRLGAPLGDFDFRVPGVTSMSMDWHKYAYCPKGASVILHRTKELRQYQIYAAAEWTGYTVINPTIQSTKSGGPMAAAWAVLNFMGDEGYMRFAKRIYDSTRIICDGIRETPGLHLVGEPDLNLVAFAAKDFSCFHLVDAMKERRWFIQPQFGLMGSEANVHLSIGQNMFERAHEFVADLQDCVRQCQDKGFSQTATMVREQVAKGMSGPPSPAMIGQLMQAAGIEDGQLPRKAAELNQILNALPPKLIEYALISFMNDRYVYRPPK
ncbi:MAG TPA: aspartate aminotransferase family protein [Alphaproteobacteria bacterium]|nr:aspartate aminotransferase family protein [Alphaproteobacteria bacterium]HAJ46951.1 aspartate aminotransferase family protein [Alphaproteobacteria bacterium]